MNLRNMFYDGEAKACAARLPGMAFVHPIEALKHMGLVFFRYADAVVRNTADNLLSGVFHRHCNLAAFRSVFDRIIDRVEEHLPQQRRIAFHFRIIT